MYRKAIFGITILFFFFALLSCSTQKKSVAIKKLNTSSLEVLDIIYKVNTYWQINNPKFGSAFWDNAAYHTGNMEVYAITKNETYRKYSETWAEQNQWMGAKSADKSQWKYKYGETNDFVLFGDQQICFQTYIDLYNLAQDPKKIARAIEVMEYQMSTEKSDYWWWVDGLYMVMPVMTKLYKVTGNQLYLDKLYEYFSYSRKLMCDEETGLFFRDAKYIYPAHTSANGKKDFWARGDGWLFAGLAKILQDMPDNYTHRGEFIALYQKMAATLADCQQPEGYWTRSIMDQEHAPGAETSGTAFFIYGYMWGINHGIFEEDLYLPVVKKGWNYLANTALQSDGRVGYVQPIGEKAIPGQVVNASSTSNFGVGAYLLAACEIYRYLNK